MLALGFTEGSDSARASARPRLEQSGAHRHFPCRHGAKARSRRSCAKSSRTGPHVRLGGATRISESKEPDPIATGPAVAAAAALDSPGPRHQIAPKWFAPSSFWNRRLPDSAPISSSSHAYTEGLVRQVEARSPWINTSFCSTPVYTVGPDQPTVRVRYVPNFDPSHPYPPTQEALNAVPLPSDARAASGQDQHLVVWQPSTDKMWEFWHMENVGGEWTAQAAGAMEHVSANPGRYDTTAWPGSQDWWGATGTSLPLLGGLITLEEMEAGQIEHALALGIADASPEFVWPAQRSDGATVEPGAIPEGTIFRLPPDLNVNALNLSPVVRAIALAAQRYGMVVRDRTAYNVILYGQDPTPTGADPYPGFFGHRSAAKLLRTFPWSHLEAISPSGLSGNE